VQDCAVRLAGALQQIGLAFQQDTANTANGECTERRATDDAAPDNGDLKDITFRIA
jgi:hypothetical protein